MADIVIGEWTEKHQKFVEAFRDRHIEKRLREMEEAERKAATESAKSTEQTEN